MIRILLLCVPLFFALSSCGPTYIYNHTYGIEKEAWTYADSLLYEVEIEDTLNIYNLYLDIEHSVDFKYQNLYTQVKTKFPGGAQIEEVLSLELQHKTGIWLGDCNSSYCTLRIPIQEGAYFNSKGKHSIFIEQFMRESPVTGVKSIALKIEDTGLKRQ